MKNPQHPVARLLDTLLIQIAIVIGSTVLLSAQVAAQPAETPAGARKDLVLKGDAQCTRCHGADAESPVLAIGKTKHGTVADGRTPTCTSCHGASANIASVHRHAPPT